MLKDQVDCGAEFADPVTDEKLIEVTPWYNYGDRGGYITGPDWNAQKIRMRVDLPEHHHASVLTHEIIHALRRSYAHPCPPDSMSYPTTSASRALITQCDLDAIYAKHDCGCQVPEAP